MNLQSKHKNLIIYLYKVLFYLALFFVFIEAYSTQYEGLLSITRTLIITSAAYLMVTLLLNQVYGNFEIGIKKSKPVVFSTLINTIITDFLVLIVLKIMGYHDINHFSIDILILIIVLFIQAIIIYFGTYLGNHIFFKLNKPEKTIILHRNSEHLPKIVNFLEKHAMQYDLINIINEPVLSEFDYESVSKIVSLDLNFEEIEKILEQCYVHNIHLMFNTQIFNVLLGSKTPNVIGDILMYEYLPIKMTVGQELIKRTMDIILSGLAIIVLAPFFFVIAFLIKMDDGGDVFFTQQRVSKDEEVFKIIKFRSMKENSSDRPACVNDERITKIGHKLRRFRVDELPQLFNIFLGDMSIVGPRPESIYLNREITQRLPEFKYRLKVKAGLTGYAQIFGKYNTDSKSKLLLDIQYIENFSILNDVKLMLQTVIVFFKHDSTEGFEEHGKK